MSRSVGNFVTDHKKGLAHFVILSNIRQQSELRATNNGGFPLFSLNRYCADLGRIGAGLSDYSSRVKKVVEMTFEKSVIGFVAACSCALVLAAVINPPASVTLSPRAELNPPTSDYDTASGVAAMVRQAKKSGVNGFTVNALSQTFSDLRYDLDRIRDDGHHVPRVFVASLPTDMRRIRVVEKKKSLFFKTVLPLVLQVNEEIRKDRARFDRVQAEMKSGKTLAAEDRLWLAAMADRYKVQRGDIDALSRRIDVIPPSLALAQAAEESGWGTSRFALEGNALFGQWIFGVSGHMTPKGRDNGKNHSIRAFPNLIDAVRAYARNLNTHRAYREFRDLRYKTRGAEADLSGRKLAGTLTRYSERGEKYVRSLRRIIDANRLTEFDGARLGAGATQALLRAPEPSI